MDDIVCMGRILIGLGCPFSVNIKPAFLTIEINLLRDSSNQVFGSPLL